MHSSVVRCDEPSITLSFTQGGAATFKYLEKTRRLSALLCVTLRLFCPALLEAGRCSTPTRYRRYSRIDFSYAKSKINSSTPNVAVFFYSQTRRCRMYRTVDGTCSRPRGDEPDRVDLTVCSRIQPSAVCRGPSGTTSAFSRIRHRNAGSAAA